MTIALSAETQRLIEERMKQTGVSTPDELIKVALQTLDQVTGVDIDELDSETRAAIEEGLLQANRRETLSWDEVRAAMRTRFLRE